MSRRGTDHMEEAGTPSPAGWLPGDSVAVSHSNLPIASSYLDGGPIQRVAGRANRSTGEPAVMDGAQSLRDDRPRQLCAPAHLATGPGSWRYEY